MTNDSLDLDILRRIQLPTAPFYEDLVLDETERVLKELFGENESVSIRRDPSGNLVAHYKGDENREKPKSIAYIVHADHPAFHLTQLRGTGMFHANMMGGLNPQLVRDGTQLNLHRIVGGEVESNVGTVVSGLDLDIKNPARRYLVGSESDGPYQFATLVLPDMTVNGDLIHAPVIDDSAGIAMSIAGLKKIVDSKLDVDVYVVVHRAEEVAFIGAYCMATSDTIPKDAIVVSVEASSYKVKKGKNGQNPSYEKVVDVGDGVLFRLGDSRASPYDPTAGYLVRTAALGMPPGSVQERGMYAGCCEAAIFHALGYRATGITLPLGGYHNNGEIDGHDCFVPEWISRGDLRAGTTLIALAAEKLAEDEGLLRSVGEVVLRRDSELAADIYRRVKAFCNDPTIPFP